MSTQSGDLARALQREIGAPPGRISILTRKRHGRKELVVRVAPGTKLPNRKLPTEFGGLSVVYETRQPGQAFKIAAN